MRWSWIVCGMALAAASGGCGLLRQTDGGSDGRNEAVLDATEDLVRDSLRYIQGRRDSLGPAAEPDDPSPEPGQVSARMVELAEGLRERAPRIEEAKRQRCVGEDSRGYLAVREDCAESQAVLADTERKNEMQQLVAAENADRKDYYNELALVMDSEAVTLTAVERLFAQSWRDRAKSGLKYQLPPEGAEFDLVQASRFGKRLGDRCVPDAWVAVD
ncbi:MAG: YdbL family protein [bacterium]|nr:YdbL family protein [bacterium]